MHGAGPQITAEMERRGIEPAFVDGRRVTTGEVLDVVRVDGGGERARLRGDRAGRVGAVR